MLSLCKEDRIGEKDGVITMKMEEGRNQLMCYNYRFAWFLVFSAETGKIVEIREYMNTALVQEVMETNP